MNESTLEQAAPGPSAKRLLRVPQVNEVRLAGRLTHDPEVRSATRDKMIVHLNVAVNESYVGGAGRMRQQTTFVPVTVWNRLAAHCTRRLSKGSAVYLEGRLRSDRWKTDKGEARTALKVEARKLQFITNGKPRTHEESIDGAAA